MLENILLENFQRHLETLLSATSFPPPLSGELLFCFGAALSDDLCLTLTLHARFAPGGAPWTTQGAGD